jgi:hypothetical protein
MRFRLLLLSSLVLASAPAAAQDLHPVDSAPVVRAARGDIGMFFRFGGLANMTAAGANSTQVTQNFLFSHAGVKFALTDRWMLPIYFGVGLNVGAQDSPGGTNVDWGMMFGGGFEYHFRIWRRISPFFGGTVGFEFNKPSGPNMLRFATSLGPQLGIEFFWADRASLAAYYQFIFSVVRAEATATTSVAFLTAAGGGLMLTFYF